MTPSARKDTPRKGTTRNGRAGKNTARKDTEQLLDRIGAVIRGLARLSGGVDEGPSLTPRQRIALVEVGEGQPLRLNALASRMGTSPPTASRAVDVLVEQGFVARVPDPDDRRALQIELTEAGAALVADRKARAVAALEPAVALLSREDRDRLDELLARLAAALD
jgi:DNA-binding MarR family transcriptional regulator